MKWTVTRVVLLIVSALSTLFRMDSQTFGAEPNVWTNLGPDGGQINVLAIDPKNPGTIYAGTFGGISKSTDGGTTWKALSVPNSLYSVSALAIDSLHEGTVYAGNFNGVFKTMDGGASWSNQQTTFSPTSLTIDFRNPDIMFAVSFGGIFKTTDGGSTWSTVDGGLEPPIAFYRLAIDPENSDNVYAGTSRGLLKSTDGGTNWTVTGNPYVVYSVAIDPQDSGTLYANDAARGLFKSVDGGTTWAAAGSGLPRNFAVSLAIDPQNWGTVYAGTSNGVFKTTNGGKDWSPANSGLKPTLVSTLGIDPQNSATIYVVAESQETFPGNKNVFKTTNGGMTWSLSGAGLAATSISGLSIDPNDPNMIYGVLSGAVIKKATGETAWGQAGNVAGWVANVSIDPQDSNTLYAAAVAAQGGGGGIFKSSDRGTDWTSVNSGLPVLAGPAFSAILAYAVAFDPQDPNTVYAGIVNSQNAGVYKSTDGGASWNASGSGLPTTTFAVVSFVFDPQHLGTVYAVLYDEWDEAPITPHAGVYKTTDGGANWNAVNNGLPTEPFGYANVSALTIDPKDSATLYAGTYQGVFKTTNGAASWTADEFGLTENITSLAIDPLNPDTLYAGTWASGVFKSADAGSHWSPVNPGLTALSIRSLVIDPKNPRRLYTGTDGAGAFIITFGPDSVVTEMRFDRTNVVAGGSFGVNIVGPDLTPQTFFDVRFTAPGSSASNVALNWQRGPAANHGVPSDISLGSWTITGVRAHEIETDHTGSFSPVSVAIAVIP